ncbi:hypothetical protein [Pseudomonas citronellolis]|uniref:hypothetical protein n=1 Tax=Pseudomonas citronellolis TaxID=53408 RepID=UPI0007185C79|nr:hypothetical protein [Pseudomonas citronellolis]KRV76370.1 hypothetical protein AO742_12620 [Pseudomonas citronellolis]KRW79595.1 hypothetical protein AO738_13645 [Pseudomonas citronellolis]
MALPQQTYIASTSDGTWKDLVVGVATISSVLANALSSDAFIGLRLRKADGSTSRLIPGNLLPLNTPHRPALGGLSLGAGDKLQVLSDAPVDWIATGAPGLAYASSVLATSGGAWATLVTGPATVRAVLASHAGPADGALGMRLLKSSGQSAAIIVREAMGEAAGKRLVAPIVLGAGDKLQVMSDERIEWIATGVE